MIQKISVATGLPCAKTRREPVQNEMRNLNAQGRDCWSCSGMCCTYEHNSMQIDPLQALELLAYLEEEGRLSDDLERALEENIARFRLDKDFSLGRGREFRRGFDCPFFLGKVKGCSIGRNAKPYGCLGFNPLQEKVSTAGKCASNLVVLTEREKAFGEREELANQKIVKELGLYWRKKSLPFALKDTLKALRKDKSERQTLELARQEKSPSKHNDLV
ncbi:MAG: hypothetical protein WD025_03890 [Bacteriovoracaceae bacterium]